MTNLDASYALLSDVNARNRDLQAKLRSSLPLLWTSNALVMKRTTRPRRRRVVADQSANGEADQMLLAVELQSSQQASRRYKRRVEWEVARRIARVDRELQQYPPAQRFWNQKRREVASPRTLSFKERARLPKTTQARDTEPKRVNVMGKNGRNEAKAKATVHHHELKSGMRPEVTLNAAPEVQCELKDVATSPLHGLVREIEQIEDTEAVTKAQPQAKIGVSGTRDTSLSDKTVVKKTPNDEAHLEATKPQKKRGASDVHVENPSFKNTVDACERSSGSEDGPLKNEISTFDILACNEEDDSPIEVERRVQKIERMEPSSSSFGRQVLSDFRTVPSVASWNAQPIHCGGTGNPAEKRLSPDVLRRLFSDLDSDRDGHINRIETCMALHRLQISVPTTKIISFFHNIYSFKSKDIQSYRAHHLPMKEVINYKEFVAFVTAAFDQQQQQKVQRTQRQVLKKAVQPPLLPSTSLPIYTHPKGSSRPNQSVRVYPTPISKQEIQPYEVDGDGSEQSEVGDRVLNIIPDFLVNRVLADNNRDISVKSEEQADNNRDISVKSEKKADNNRDISLESEGAAVDLVRKSLELWLEREAADGEVVSEITQELIKERPQKSKSLKKEAFIDTTGLEKAAAYYDEKMMQEDAECCSDNDASNHDNLGNWVDLLAKEQVGGMVRQFWRDKQASTNDLLAPTKDVDMPKDHLVKLMDVATNTNEHPPPEAPSAKAVQAFEDENNEKVAIACEKIVVADSNVNPEKIVFSTHFGRSIRDCISRSIHDNSSDMLRPITNIELLRRLRQERRMHQSLSNEQQTQLPCKQTRGPSVMTCDGEKMGVDVDVKSNSSSDKIFESNVSSSAEQLDFGAEQQDPTSSLTIDPAPLDQISLNPMHDLDVSCDKSSLVSYSVSSSSLSNSNLVDGMHQKIDHQLEARTRCIRHLRPRQRYRRRRSSSVSSDPDSICSAELSEGELVREEGLDLSDGELFGKWKSKCIERKNTILTRMESKEEASQNSSVESGEIPELMTAHANFRRQVVAQSLSSIESGEIEDGAF